MQAAPAAPAPAQEEAPAAAAAGVLQMPGAATAAGQPAASAAGAPAVDSTMLQFGQLNFGATAGDYGTGFGSFDTSAAGEPPASGCTKASFTKATQANGKQCCCNLRGAWCALWQPPISLASTPLQPGRIVQLHRVPILNLISCLPPPLTPCSCQAR